MSQEADQEELPAEPPQERSPRRTWLHTKQARSTRRWLLLTALGGLLLAGVATVAPVGDEAGRLLGAFGTNPLARGGAPTNEALNHATSGTCLTWPDGSLNSATVVDCSEDHKFEVAEAVDMKTFPGSEYGPGAPLPSRARIEQITQEQCEPAVHRYLGPRFDPVGKFVTSMLWSESAWSQHGERRMLCGLQLPGANDQHMTFRGKVADLDQSNVWPVGTCLGIDQTSNQPNDVPVDCGAPHAMEITGTVNLAEKFPDVLPAEPDQDSFIKEECTRLTDSYLAPIQLRTTTLTLIYKTVSLPSWSAGSREVACSIGATLGNGGWATLLNSAKGPVLINGHPPVPPPDIPEERLNLPPIPMQGNTGAGTPSNGGAGSPQRGNQHLPQQPAGPPPQQQQPAPQQPAQPPAAPPAPAPEGPAPEAPPPGEPPPGE